MQEDYSTAYFVATVALDLVASLSCLKDDVLNEQLAQTHPRRFLALLNRPIHPTSNGINFQLVGRSLPSVQNANYDDSMCIPILPTTSHPERYAPITTSTALPFSRCLVYTIQPTSTFARVTSVIPPGNSGQTCTVPEEFMKTISSACYRDTNRLIAGDWMNPLSLWDADGHYHINWTAEIENLRDMYRFATPGTLDDKRAALQEKILDENWCPQSFPNGERYWQPAVRIRLDPREADTLEMPLLDWEGECEQLHRSVRLIKPPCTF